MDNHIPTDLHIKEKDQKGLYENIFINDIPLDTILNYLPDQFLDSQEYKDWLSLNQELLNDKFPLKNEIENVSYYEILKKLLLLKYNNEYDLKIDSLFDFRKKFLEYYSSKLILLPILKNTTYDTFKNLQISNLDSYTVVKVEKGQLLTDITAQNKKQKNEIFNEKYDEIKKLYEESNNFLINMKHFLLDEYKTLDDAKKRKFESIINVGMLNTDTYFNRDAGNYVFEMNKILDKMFTMGWDNFEFIMYLILFKYNGFIEMKYSDAIIQKLNLGKLLKNKYYSTLEDINEDDDTKSIYFNISVGSLDNFINSNDVLNNDYSIV